MSNEELKELKKLATKLLDELGYVAPEIRQERALEVLDQLAVKILKEQGWEQE